MMRGAMRSHHENFLIEWWKEQYSRVKVKKAQERGKKCWRTSWRFQSTGERYELCKNNNNKKNSANAKNQKITRKVEKQKKKREQKTIFHAK